MVEPDAKITAAARNFLERYGEDAPAQAKRRAQEMHLFGRAKGYATWMQILKEINSLLDGNSEEILH
ncbi:MAG: hypothetical protein H8E39_10310 [Alphaproteobacteria bacterium]|nr:hypothetical protein [Alphaproteobacteria bacterium]